MISFIKFLLIPTVLVMFFQPWRLDAAPRCGGSPARPLNDVAPDNSGSGDCSLNRIRP